MGYRHRRLWESVEWEQEEARDGGWTSTTTSNSIFTTGSWTGCCPRWAVAAPLPVWEQAAAAAAQIPSRRPTDSPRGVASPR